MHAEPMRRLLAGLIDYLLGFLALTFFAFLAFGRPNPTDEHLVFAFKAAAPVAVAELAALAWRTRPANRLILGANLWLIAGGLAAWLEQWWWLLAYKQWGEAGLFATMMTVGFLSTAFSPTGFVGAVGPRHTTVIASAWLLVAVGFALLAAIYFRGDVKLAAVVRVIALSWVNRLLRHWVSRGEAV